MTKITIDLTKTIEANAEVYYEKAKRSKRKIPGVENALQNLNKKLLTLKPKPRVEKKTRSKKWFEKFKWFISSEGLLVIGGRDATTNDIIIKKYTETDDLVFHTELPGSPFVVIKADKKTIGNSSKEEAALFCASHSRAWSENRATANVYSVNSDQIKKELGLPKVTFMIYGKRTYFTPKLELAACKFNDTVMIGPENAIKTHSENYYIITLGDDKKSDIAKKLKKLLDTDINEIMQALPPGDAKVKIK